MTYVKLYVSYNFFSDHASQSNDVFIDFDSLKLVFSEDAV